MGKNERRRTNTHALSLTKLLWVTVWAALCALVHLLARSLALSLSFSVPPAYVTHRFTRPVAQRFFLASYDSPNFPVFVGNHVRYFPPISLHYLISYAVRTNVLSCQRSSSHVFTHGISTSVYSGFFILRYSSHRKIRDTVSFSRLVTLGQLLPTRGWSSINYFIGQAKVATTCCRVFSVSWSMNSSVFARSPLAEPHHFSSSMTVVVLMVAGVKWPLSDSWRFCNVHGASVETITYAWCIGAQQLAIGLKNTFLWNPRAVHDKTHTTKKWSYCSKKYLKKCV